MDGSILRLGYGFNGQGLPYQQTSYSDSAGTTIVNQVQDQYNGFGQIIGEYQSHSGPVVTASTPEVRYGYTETSGGTVNNSRPTSLTYPNGRVLSYVYNSGLDDAVSRISGESDAAGSAAGLLQGYSYLGVGTVVGQSFGNGVNETISLDNFGRVGEISYVNPSTGSGQADDFQYGYDRDGNVLYKNNLVNGVFSELYHANSATAGDNNSAYDPLGRLTGFSRGTLSASGNNGGSLDTISSPSATASWSLDALGNWTGSTTNGTSTTRTNNARNQTTTVGAQSLTFDNNGNTTTDDKGQTYGFDAWNRMVWAKAPGPTPLTTYGWDADGRRITETPASSGTTTDLFFSIGGQVLEERQAATVAKQYVWSAVGYVNDLVLRDDNSVAGSLGATSSGLGQRLYVQQDANHDVTALTDTSGNVKQRFVEDPYGTVTVLSPTWTNATDAYSWSYGFQGGRVDPITGLYHFGARDYSPTLGRWMQPDPAGYVNGVNYFQFALSDPIALTDPTGLVAPKIAAKGQNWQPLLNTLDHVGKALSSLAPATLGAAQMGMAVFSGMEGAPNEAEFDEGEQELEDAGAAGLNELEQAVNELENETQEAAQAESSGMGQRENPPYPKSTAPDEAGEPSSGGDFGDQDGSDQPGNDDPTQGQPDQGTGNYRNTHQSGKTYSGKGGIDRMNKSANRIADENDDPVVSQTHSSAPDDKQSFIQEQNDIEAAGGPGGNTYNRINSPGKKLRDGN